MRRLLLTLALICFGLAGLTAIPPTFADEQPICPDGLTAVQAGELTLCSHGDDNPPPGEYRNVDNAVRIPAFADKQGVPARVECVGDNVSGFRVEILYAFTLTSGNRMSQYGESFRQWAADADQIYSNSAERTGGDRHIRFLTDATCRPKVTPVNLTNEEMASMSNMVQALYQQGFNRPDRKYLIFADANVYCGIGTLMPDETKDPLQNQNNRTSGWARVDAGCWGGFVAAHELTHNLGGVQAGAPNATNYGHCDDDNDVMCYNDGPGTVIRKVCILAAEENLLDCQNDDYFNTNPLAGTYLASHWNVADSPYLLAMAPPPDPSLPSCQLSQSIVRPKDVLILRCINMEPGTEIVARWVNFQKDRTFAGTIGPDGIGVFKVKVLNKLGTGTNILRITSLDSSYQEDVSVQIFGR